MNFLGPVLIGAVFCLIFYLVGHLRGKNGKKALPFLLALLLVPGAVNLADAAYPFTRTVTWTLPATYTDTTPIPANDNIVVHVYVCTSATDNTVCTEVGQSTPDAVSWTGDVPAATQPVNTERWYRTRARSTLYAGGPQSAYSLPERFFLEAPVPMETGRPGVR